MNEAQENSVCFFSCKRSVVELQGPGEAKEREIESVLFAIR